MKNTKNPITIFTLTSATINTPLGDMIAIADESALYLLEFTNRKNSGRQLQDVQIKTNATIAPGNNDILELVKKELALYFAGKLKNFTIPLRLLGTIFQEKTWNALTKVPYGTTFNYAQLAAGIGNKDAFRAVANANSANKIAIVVPCHRIIKSDGDLCGYAGGIERKQWLIDHEKQNLLVS